MQFDSLSLVALSAPFLIILIGMIGLKWSALKAGSVALAVTLLGAPYFLGIHSFYFATDILPGSAFEALITSLSILWIIFGALCIYYLQLNSGAITSIQQRLAHLHPNPKVSALFIAWFFSMFMEGAAGFGTSAALTAPFLVAAGYRPVIAVVLALWGHSLGVAFGAVGTPVITQALLVGETELALGQAVLPYLLPTTFVLAIGLAWGCVRYGPNVENGLVAEVTFRKRHILSIGALAAASFLLPAGLLAHFLGPELPTLLGAVIGAVLFTLSSRLGLALILRFKQRYADKFALKVLPTSENHPKAAGLTTENAGEISFLKAMAPYLILITLVLITRLMPELKAMLQALHWQFEWRNYQGSMAYLYHPGTLLVVSFLIGALLQRQNLAAVLQALWQAFLRVLSVLAALFVMLLLSRVLVHAGAIAQLGELVAGIAGSAWPFWAAWFGVLGTFITGSATSSNILFSEFQRSAALASGQAPLPLLGAQTFGAAVGNMVCPHNIIASGATVNIQGDEGQVMKYTLPMAIVLTITSGIIAMIVLA